MPDNKLQQICLEFQLAALYAFGSRAVEAAAFLESRASSMTLRGGRISILAFC